VETSHEIKVTILWNQEAKTPRTIPNNKPNIMIHDNEKETYLLMDKKISGNINVIKKEDENFKIQRGYTRNMAYADYENESDSSNNRGNWNRLKIFQKISEKYK
jgi:hypothetical protein